MKKLSIIALCSAIAMPAMANIASTEYVDGVKTTLQQSIDTKMNGKFNVSEATALITDNSGNVTTGKIVGGMINDGAVNTAQLADTSVTNAKIANEISIEKLDLPDDRCSGADATCVVVYDADTNGFVWENIGRVFSQQQ